METAELRRRFSASPVARLATVRPDGGPHAVPVVFAAVGDTVYTAVDAKPKRTRQLQRLVNLRAESRCTVLVDHYEEDWSRLWWVRVDGVAAVVKEPPTSHPGIEALVERYAQYREQPPAGPLLVVTVVRWNGWSST